MDALDKKYYRIRQVAEMLQESPPTLRFWEAKFTVICPKRSSTGRRLYTSQDIEALRMVKYLVHERGLKIEAAQEHLRRNREDISQHARAVERLRDIRARLQGLLDAINTR